MIKYFIFLSIGIIGFILLAFNIKNIDVNDAWRIVIIVFPLLISIIFLDYWFETRLTQDQKDTINNLPLAIGLNIFAFVISLKIVNRKNILMSKEQLEEGVSKRKLDYYVIYEHWETSVRVKEYRRFISFLGLYLLVTERSKDESDLVKCLNIDNQIKSNQNVSKFKL